MTPEQQRSPQRPTGMSTTMLILLVVVFATVLAVLAFAAASVVLV
ncbi:MAG: hypothetical protein JWQ89_3882 [Devosia sp.]|nr:hypothetical protein [Devosia sp.]